MGMSTSAYHFYGVNIPADQWLERWAGAEGELIDVAINAVKADAPDVGYITAGDYDRDMLFLCIRQGGSVEVELGTFKVVRPSALPDPGWDAQLLAVVQSLGYQQTSEPGWITVPDVS